LTVIDIGVLSAGLTLAGGLAALSLLAWFRHGRDPYFADDDSVLMPSPPSDFTPALASVVMHGSASRRTIFAGLMYLASRNLIAFRAEPFPVGHRAGLALTTHRPHHLQAPAPEAELYASIAAAMPASGYIAAIFLDSLNDAFRAFTGSLDKLAVERGWLRARPGPLIHKWRILAGVEALCGVLLAGWIAPLAGGPTGPSQMSVAAVGFGAVVAGAVTFLVSGAMPARTAEGASLAAMLNAYRRTLKVTIAQADTVEQVVVMAPLPWVNDPTSEIAWAVAFGLDREIDSLLSQSLEVSESGGWPTGIRDWFSVF
jgi:hypothetical protein